MKTSLIGSKVRVTGCGITPVCNITKDVLAKAQNKTGLIVAAHVRQGYLIFTIWFWIGNDFLEATSDMLHME